MSPRAIYESAWHHPGALLPPALVVLAWVLARRPGGWFGGWLLLASLDTAIDCWLTSYVTPLQGGAARAAAIAFVITGDLRCYALLERYRGGSLGRAVGWSLVASLLVGLATKAAPGVFTDTRRVFLLYEAISLGLMGYWGFVLVPKMGSEERGWMGRVKKEGCGA